MSQADLDINRNTRRILVRHWVDLGRLSVRCSSGILSIRGSLQRISGMDKELTTSIVEAMIMEMKRIQNVRRVNLDLKNWTTDGGRWRPIGKALLEKREIDMREAQAPPAVPDMDKKMESDA